MAAGLGVDPPWELKRSPDPLAAILLRGWRGSERIKGKGGEKGAPTTLSGYVYSLCPKHSVIVCHIKSVSLKISLLFESPLFSVTVTISACHKTIANFIAFC